MPQCVYERTIFSYPSVRLWLNFPAATYWCSTRRRVPSELNSSKIHLFPPTLLLFFQLIATTTARDQSNFICTTIRGLPFFRHYNHFATLDGTLLCGHEATNQVHIRNLIVSQLQLVMKVQHYPRNNWKNEPSKLNWSKSSWRDGPYK